MLYEYICRTIKNELDPNTQYYLNLAGVFVEEAYDREYNLALIEDICQTYNDKLQDFTLDDLNESRPDLDVVRLETFLW